MDFQPSDRAREWHDRVRRFLDEHVIPREAEHFAQVREDATRQPPVMEAMKAQAREAGLWNMFLPGDHGAGLTNLEYAPLAELMGRHLWSAEVFNCNAPDTGNMEVLHMYGDAEQQARWLKPLMAGEIRSAFLMTEPEVASSDATNIQTRIERDGDHYVINGRKWWSTNMGHPNVAMTIVMGKTDPDAATHAQQSQIIVPVDTPGFRVERMLSVFGYDEKPIGHAEVVLENVRVPVENLIAGEGRGFEIAQGRLGPGRIHHCMRAVGLAERALEMMCRRLSARTAFGKPLAQQGVMIERIAQSRIEIDQVRLLVLHATIELGGGKAGIGVVVGRLLRARVSRIVKLAHAGLVGLGTKPVIGLAVVSLIPIAVGGVRGAAEGRIVTEPVGHAVGVVIGLAVAPTVALFATAPELATHIFALRRTAALVTPLGLAQVFSTPMFRSEG